MTFDWRGEAILEKCREGCILREAAAAAGLTKQGAEYRMKQSPSFAAAVKQAREIGAEERRFRCWLRHPFRGRRPPMGKGHGGRPAFVWGRR